MRESTRFAGAWGTGLVLLLTSNISQAESPATIASEGGEILLSEVETYGVDPEWCHIPAEPGTYMLNKRPGCYTDDYDLIRFVNAPSALTVTVMDRGDCNTSDSNDNWRFVVQTVKQPTTTPGDGTQLSDWMRFRTIWNTENGKVVTPGTMKVKHHGNSPPDTNETSCVVVTRE